MDRAYTLLEIKSIDDEQRIIEGIASTPTPDRAGDIMDPAGAQFTLPLPFLWHHNRFEPVGEVFAAAVSAGGISIKARIAKVTEPGPLKDRLDEAWQSIKAKLVRGLSIGWKGIDVQRIEGSSGLHVKKWLWAELSAVTIPQNIEATILNVKELDQAASGRHTSGATDRLPVVHALKGATPMTIAEQITQWSNTRAPKAARMAELMTKAADTGVTLDAAQSEEYDGLDVEIKSIDVHLGRLRAQEQSQAAAATALAAAGGRSAAAASDLRGGNQPVIQVKSTLPKGTAFTRYVMAIAAGKGDYMRTIEHAKQWKDSTPEVLQMVELQLKAAVAPGTTTDATWAGPLVQLQPLVDEFLELLRPKTLLGRIPGIRNVPFNVAVNSQTGGGTYGWVGQNKPKPVTSAAFATVSLTFAKAAGIIVITEELARNSRPSAEDTVRNEMIAGISQFLDTQFVDPAVAAVAGVNPASITNGAPATAASGVTAAAARADLVALVAGHVAAGIPLAESVLLMSESTAFALSVSLNALGQKLFPGMSIAGGVIDPGISVVVSNNVGNRVILVHAPSILMADEGGVSVDVSREASIQMDSAPTDPTDASTVLVSLWQRNLVGLRAERFITWLRGRTGSVRLITGAAYAAT